MDPKHPTHETEDIMTAKDAAALLGVSAPTIKRMVLDGRIVPVTPYRPYVKRQNLRFTRAEVLRVKNLPLPEKPPRKKRRAPAYEVTAVYTPPAVADVERLLRQPTYPPTDPTTRTVHEG
jgi:excisionase family DNA binding protein